MEGGWRIDGRKIFCTGVPAATTLYASLTYADAAGNPRCGYAMVPVRAMNPLAANRAYEVVGMAALGLDPSLS